MPEEPEVPPESETVSFREAFSDAMRKTGIGQVAPGEVPTARSLLGAVGGIRGLIESLLPGLAFLVLYTVTKNLAIAVLVPVAIAVIFIVVRALTKSPVSPSITGLLLLAVSAVLALVTGRAENSFIPGMLINAGSLLVLLVSIAARWPLIGVIVGFLTNETSAWRQSPPKRRVLYLTTFLWAGLFALRLAVEVPLYLAHEAEWLAGTKLALGVPLYALLLWITWLLIRSVYARSASSDTAAAAGD